MRCTLMILTMLFFKTAPLAAQAPSSDSQMTQTVLAEIREFRQDLRNAAATIQRVQIVMYRLQAQAALVAKTEERLEQARMICKQAESQRKSVAGQIEKAEARKRNAQDPTEQQREEHTISALQSSVEMWAAQAQSCQADQTDAEIQYRNEQAKMDQLESLLGQLDHVLAADARK